MKYTEAQQGCKDILAYPSESIPFDGLVFERHSFSSPAYAILPGNDHYHCNVHNVDIRPASSHYNDIGQIQGDVYISDYEVTENRAFHYYLLKPPGSIRASRVTILLHGFNEKNWEKYLPWAHALCKRTGDTIVLFPIAFHMQRAPAAWSEKRNMFRLSEERKKRFPNILHSTLSNVAISMRLHSRPQRFIWSGLQTYHDLIHFVEQCKQGLQPAIDPSFRFNIFAYSIGGLLAQILKLSNPQNMFADTRLCLFCGGAVFNRMSPVSKFILDSEAKVALYYFIIEHLDSFIKKDELLAHYLGAGHFEGEVFRSMLDYQYRREFRESLFRKYENDVMAIGLRNDSVIPSFEIRNTLQGAFGDIRIPVEELEFSFHSTHEVPFPADQKNADAIDSAFDTVFDRAASFLAGK